MTKHVLFVVMPCAAVSVAAPIDAKKLGSSLATSLSETLETMRALANRGQGDDASFRQSMLDTLMSKQEVLTNPEVNTVIARANSLAQSQTSPVDELCVRDWSRRCPDGWEDAGAAGCLAPESYQGGCKRIQHFQVAGEQSRKINFASSCSAPWACVGSEVCPLGRDYESCPLGWVPVGQGFCSQAPDSSKCNLGVMNFRDMTISEKQVLSNECDITWACRVSCQRDYRAQCPEGWEKQMDLCVAPAEYAGDCSYSVDTSYFTDSQKESWASRCGVQWQCVEPGQHAQTKRHALSQTLKDGPIRQGIDVDSATTMELTLPKAWFTPSGPLAIVKGS